MSVKAVEGHTITVSIMHVLNDIDALDIELLQVSSFTVDMCKYFVHDNQSHLSNCQLNLQQSNANSNKQFNLL